MKNLVSIIEAARRLTELANPETLTLTDVDDLATAAQSLQELLTNIELANHRANMLIMKAVLLATQPR